MALLRLPFLARFALPDSSPPFDSPAPLRLAALCPILRRHSIGRTLCGSLRFARFFAAVRFAGLSAACCALPDSSPPFDSPDSLRLAALRPILRSRSIGRPLCGSLRFARFFAAVRIAGPSADCFALPYSSPPFESPDPMRIASLCPTLRRRSNRRTLCGSLRFALLFAAVRLVGMFAARLLVGWVKRGLAVRRKQIVYARNPSATYITPPSHPHFPHPCKSIHAFALGKYSAALALRPSSDVTCVQYRSN
jgi:hypothetical protein